MKKLGNDFYQRTNVLQIAKDLLGKVLVTRWKGLETSGRIVEVEAYRGVTDRASHAYGGRRTSRNEIMYAAGGVAYIYLCYGLHHLVNVVTHEAGTPHAILIRGIEPLEGMELMQKRKGGKKTDPAITRGPGKLAVALGLHTGLNGWSLQSHDFFIADDGFQYSKEWLVSSPRIGVDYAGDDALLPYRFYIRGHAFVSGKPK